MFRGLKWFLLDRQKCCRCIYCVDSALTVTTSLLCKHDYPPWKRGVYNRIRSHHIESVILHYNINVNVWLQPHPDHKCSPTLFQDIYTCLYNQMITTNNSHMKVLATLNSRTVKNNIHTLEGLPKKCTTTSHGPGLTPWLESGNSERN